MGNQIQGSGGRNWGLCAPVSGLGHQILAVVVGIEHERASADTGRRIQEHRMVRIEHGGLDSNRGGWSWLRKVPAMCHIRTSIDLRKEKLYVESPHSNVKLQISLQKNSSCKLKEEMDVYGQRYEVQTYNNEVDMWFTEAINRPCTFVRCVSSKNHHCLNNGGVESLCRDLRSKLNFANEAQFLLVSEGSVNDLNRRLTSDNEKGNSRFEQPTLVDAMRFRPNLVVSGAEPFAEDNWNGLHIGKAHFVSLGGCNRCQMINIDQRNGQAVKAREPLRTLASYRRVQGKILFGVLLRYENTAIIDDSEAVRIDEDEWLRVGQEVHPSIN